MRLFTVQSAANRILHGKYIEYHSHSILELKTRPGNTGSPGGVRDIKPLEIARAQYLSWKMYRSSLSELTTDEFLLFIEFRNVFVSFMMIVYNIHTYSIHVME